MYYLLLSALKDSVGENPLSTPKAARVSADTVVHGEDPEFVRGLGSCVQIQHGCPRRMKKMGRSTTSSPQKR